VRISARSKVVRKDALIRVRVTEAQRLVFAKAATQAGLDLSSWLRTVALDAVERRRPFAANRE
jgi:uncharacterized protein (DUF1778 family)